jgi:large exoprotein involved in heme utilization and adhesion
MERYQVVLLALIALTLRSKMGHDRATIYFIALVNSQFQRVVQRFLIRPAMCRIFLAESRVIQANGAANLFLINPNGILFGPNARLNIGGSFIGTTASRIQFADNTEFSARFDASQPLPLLTMSAPIGIQMGQNPGRIQNRSTVTSASPYQVNLASLSLSPLWVQLPAGLQVQPGKSLILLGGDVLFEGGAATALNGQIELAGVGANNFVSLSSREFGFELNYDNVQAFQNVTLNRFAILDARDAGVRLKGRQINILNGSAILADLVTQIASRNIDLEATESIRVAGFTSVETLSGSVLFRTWINTNTNQNDNAKGGAIALKAPIITISDQVSVITNTIAGQGGDLTIKADQFNIFKGGVIGASTSDRGNSGNLDVQATDIQVSGLIQLPGRPTLPSVLFTVANRGTGNAGTLRIQTDRLRISNGGIVAANTFDQGNAGNLIIQARDFIEISDANPQSIFATGLLADASLSPFPNQLEGNGGNIQLTTGKLLVQSGGVIAVGNPGRGDAGNLTINADAVTLKQGTLNASIEAGKQGNIRINTNVLLMRNNSQIKTNAAARANGGTITINSPIITGLENSDIVATAIQGSGGNIQIATQGIIGLQYRNRFTPASDITASSEFGVNGTVQVNNIGVDPSSGLLELPVEVIDPNQQVAQTCDPGQGSSFVMTGRGGMPENPTQHFRPDRTWKDIRFIPPNIILPNRHTAAQIPETPTIVEASSWYRTDQGQVILQVDKAASQAVAGKETCVL